MKKNHKHTYTEKKHGNVKQNSITENFANEMKETKQKIIKVLN